MRSMAARPSRRWWRAAPVAGAALAQGCCSAALLLLAASAAAAAAAKAPVSWPVQQQAWQVSLAPADAGANAQLEWASGVQLVDGGGLRNTAGATRGVCATRHTLPCLPIRPADPTVVGPSSLPEH